MSSGARRGRRDNGLDAADFVVAGDVDPRVGEHLLDVLGAGGIAAYLQPSSDLNPVTRTTTVPARPVDRLYVDSAHLKTARDYLERLGEDPPPDGAGDTPAKPTNGHDPDVDAAWAEIVAGYDAQVDATAAPWPAAENLPTDPPAGRPGPDGTEPTTRRRPSAAGFSGISVTPRPDDRPPRPTDRTRPDDRPPWPDDRPAGRDDTAGGDDEPSLLDALDTFGDDLPGEPTDEEGYTPPPPPPLPRISKYAVLGVLGIVGGFLLFLFPGVLPVDAAVATVFGFLAILAGFVTLISRMRGSDEDRGPDDGAVV